jgi:hypothetical protein
VCHKLPDKDLLTKGANYILLVILLHVHNVWVVLFIEQLLPGDLKVPCLRLRFLAYFQLEVIQEEVVVVQKGDFAVLLLAVDRVD